MEKNLAKKTKKIKKIENNPIIQKNRTFEIFSKEFSDCMKFVHENDLMSDYHKIYAE